MKDGIHSKAGYNCGKVEIVLDLVLIVVDIYSVCYYWCLHVIICLLKPIECTTPGVNPLQGEKGDADVENRLAATVWGGDGGSN